MKKDESFLESTARDITLWERDANGKLQFTKKSVAEGMALLLVGFFGFSYTRDPKEMGVLKVYGHLAPCTEVVVNIRSIRGNQTSMAVKVILHKWSESDETYINNTTLYEGDVPFDMNFIIKLFQSIL